MISNLNAFLFSTPEVTGIFSPNRQLRSMMRFEWALTCALEKEGIAQQGSASIVKSLMEAEFVDTVSLENDAATEGNIVIPFVQQLTAAVKARDEKAALTIHLGATSQDVLDTVLVLQMRDALKILDEWLERTDQHLANQVRAHAHTVMLGRTWLQQGPPTTLGLKLAGILAALRRHRERIHSAAERVLVLQFGGAVGTLAPLGNAGAAVSAEMARVLTLREPELPWHTNRDALAEVVQVLGLLTGTLAKLARDIALLTQSEVAEASEGKSENLGGSSTMPHKHNPVACAAVIAAHARMPGLVATMLNAMPQEHERGLGLWQAEWETVPEAFRLASAALGYSMRIAEGLQVNKQSMQSNIDAALGLPLSEAVNTALAPSMGRSAAHEVVRTATRHALEEGRHLASVLKEMPEITAHLTVDAIDRLFEPSAYLGSADRFINRVLEGK